ncbi:MAG: GTP-binding protein [Neomegalonema sp.]|nr:GTP-binding protein [Neomegalonema sp.]
MRGQSKIILLGQPGVGKTSLFRRFLHDEFRDDYHSTLGATPEPTRPGWSTAPDLQGHGLMLWDVAGGLDEPRLLEPRMRGAAGAVLVSDLTRPATIAPLADYAQKLLALEPACALLFVLNKDDLSDDRARQSQEIARLADAFAADHLSTSARTGHNVLSAFEALARAVRAQEES